MLRNQCSNAVKTVIAKNKMKVEYPEIGPIYHHYKGGSYLVITMANHSETNEAMVVYKSILFGSIYTRPLSMWFDEIELEDKTKVLRFSL